MRPSCCLCMGIGDVGGCPCCGRTSERNPVVEAWGEAHDALEAKFGRWVGLAYGPTYATVRLCGAIVAEVHDAPDPITAIRQVTRMALQGAA